MKADARFDDLLQAAEERESDRAKGFRMGVETASQWRASLSRAEFRGLVEGFAVVAEADRSADLAKPVELSLNLRSKAG